MKRILCFGDSNTWGHNPEPEGTNFRYADDERWTGVLQSMLEGEAKIIEEGLCGRTVMYDDPTSPDRNGSRFLNCFLQSHQPLDMVILMLGTNDIRHIFTPCVREIAIGVSNLVNQIQNPYAYWVGKVPEVLVIAPAPVREELPQSEFYGMYDEESITKSRALAGEYEKIFAGRAGVQVLDAGKIAEVSVKDCIHLSREGHRKLAEAVCGIVRETLGLTEN